MQQSIVKFYCFVVQRQLDGLLMMGIIMPETCWAVSVRQSNKILQLIVSSSWVFYLSNWISPEKTYILATEGSTLYTLRCCLVNSPQAIESLLFRRLTMRWHEGGVHRQTLKVLNGKSVKILSALYNISAYFQAILFSSFNLIFFFPYYIYIFSSVFHFSYILSSFTFLLIFNLPLLSRQSHSLLPLLIPFIGCTDVTCWLSIYLFSFASVKHEVSSAMNFIGSDVMYCGSRNMPFRGTARCSSTGVLRRRQQFVSKSLYFTAKLRKVQFMKF